MGRFVSTALKFRFVKVVLVLVDLGGIDLDFLVSGTLRLWLCVVSTMLCRGFSLHLEVVLLDKQIRWMDHLFGLFEGFVFFGKELNHSSDFADLFVIIFHGEFVHAHRICNSVLVFILEEVLNLVAVNKRGRDILCR